MTQKCEASLFLVFEEVSRCLDFDERLTLSDNLNNRLKKTLNFELNCKNFELNRIFIVQNSVKEFKKQKYVQHLRLNIPAIISFLEIGCGYRSLEQFPH